MPTLNPKQVPAWTAKAITKATLEELERFFREPANLKAFEEWKQKQA